MEIFEYLKNAENIELIIIGILLLFTFWFIGNTIQFYKSEKRKIKHLHRFAKEGELEAQNKLAKRYEKGDMVKKDCDRAAFWYQNAAFNGDKIARGHLRAFLNKRKKKKKC
jgi:TPR repeat protein